MKVSLTIEEQLLVKTFANLRWTFARLRGVQDLKAGGQSCEDTDLDGMGAEIAFCKLFNLFPRSFQLKPDEGFDCVRRTGEKIDVKTTRYETGHLVAPLRAKEKPADIYALMIGRFPDYEYRGCVRSKDFFKDENIKVLKTDRCYALEQEKLALKLD